MHPINHTFAFTSAFVGSTAACACRLCRGPISLDDGFGLSERVCRACVPRVERRESPRRLVPAWLRRAA